MMPRPVRFVTLFLLGFGGMVVSHVVILLIISLSEQVKLKVPFYPLAYFTVFPGLTWMWCRRHPDDRIAAPLLMMLMPFGYWFGLLWSHVRVDFSQFTIYSSMIMIFVMPATAVLSVFTGIRVSRQTLRRRAEEEAKEITSDHAQS